MTNAELIAALKDAEMYLDYVAPICYASIEAAKAIRAAADTLKSDERKIEDLETALAACRVRRGEQI